MEHCLEVPKSDEAVSSGQSMAWHHPAVAVLLLKDLEACLGGSLSIGFLSLTLTGKFQLQLQAIGIDIPCLT